MIRTLKSILFITLSLIAFSAYSIEFESTHIHGLEKEILSERQIRFSDIKNPSYVVHLQIDKYDPANLWQEKTLKKDIESMLETRKSIYGVFGFSDVNFYHYSLNKFEAKLPCLTIFGSYVKPKNKKVYFSETNIYYQQNFLQVKIINEITNVSQEDINKILQQIKPLELEIK